MIEKIKERPVNKRKLLRRTVITAAMAVIFGLIACLTFLILEPVFSNWLYPEEEPKYEYVEFPEETDEMPPEDMVVEQPEPDLQETVETVLQETVESVLLESGQIEEVLSKWVLNAENYKQLYAAMSEYTEELSKSVVTVTGVSSGTDWFDNTYESTSQVSGVIVADNGKELLILADRSALSRADSITVTFCSGQQTQAVQKQYDKGTGLAVFAVELADLSQETIDQTKTAELGSSNLRNMVGMPVVAMGSPMGVKDSVNYGMITAAGSRWSVVDANYKLLLTDMYGSQYASGVLFNMQSQVVGIITTGKNGTDMRNLITGIGISELRKVVTRMSNGTPAAYMGISGIDVTMQANMESGVPLGAYVTDVVRDSPAMLAGIQRGDIIVQMNDVLIGSFGDYTTALLRMAPESTVKVTVKRQVQEDYRDVEIDITLDESR